MPIRCRDKHARFLRDIASLERKRKTRTYCDTDEQFDREIVYPAVDEFTQRRLRHAQLLCSRDLRSTSLTHGARHLQSEVTPERVNCGFVGQHDDPLVPCYDYIKSNIIPVTVVQSGT